MRRWVVLSSFLVACGGGMDARDASPDGRADAGPFDAGRAGPLDAGPCVPTITGELIDRTLSSEPSVTLPGAGGSFVDPTFGTTIVRVTAQTDGQDSTHGYGYWSPFNADSTRFHILEGGTPTLYSLAPDTGAIAAIGPLFEGVDCNWEDAAWSHTDPNLLFCHTTTPRRLYRYDASTRGPLALTLVHDFDADLGTGEDTLLWQMSVDAADDVFTFHTRIPGAGDVGERAVVYVRSSDEVFVRDYSGQGLNETNIDQEGGVIVAQLLETYEVWEYRNDTAITIEHTAEQRAGSGHLVLGRGIMVQGDGWETGFLRRDLADPQTPVHLVSYLNEDGSLNWTIADHPSINHRDQRFFIVSNYSTSTTWRPWQQEILAIAIDGSWVRRLAHHHSVQNGDYWSQPRASVSYDGRWVAFTSNFDDDGLDVFLLQVPPLCE